MYSRYFLFPGLVIFIIYLLAGSFLGRWLAGKKGYSTAAWFWLCFLFGIFALLTIAGAPNKIKQIQKLDTDKNRPEEKQAQPDIPEYEASAEVLNAKVEAVVNRGKGDSFNFLTYSLKKPDLLLNVHAAGDGRTVKQGDIISSKNFRNRSDGEKAIREATEAEIKRFKNGDYTGPINYDLL